MLLAAVLALSCAAFAEPVADRARGGWPQIQLGTAAGGVRYGFVVGGGAAAGPRPVLISLTGALSDTLGCNATGTTNACYYANACEYLVPAGWICASLDLPSHGLERQPGEPEGIAGWRWRVDRGQDIVAQNNERVRAMVADLMDRGLVDDASPRIAVSGISRGGFLAAHFAIAEPRVRCVGLMSPVTNLTLLLEFDGYAGTLADSLSLSSAKFTAQLVGKNIWSIIGDQDTRVYTDSLVTTMRRIQCFGCQPGPRGAEFGCTGCPSRAGETRLRVEYEPEGHTVPPSALGGRPTFQTLAAWMQAKMAAAAPAAPSLHGTNRTLLLIDDHDVLYHAGTKRVLQPMARLTPGVPAVAPTEDWEALLGYVSPHRMVDGSLVLYYQCYGPGMVKISNSTCGVCLATSGDDGGTWAKPKLGVFAGTNVVFSPGTVPPAASAHSTHPCPIPTRSCTYALTHT